MRIQFERSGGFAGLHLTTEVDTGQLDPQEARLLVEELNAAGFFELPTRLAPPGQTADGFYYRISVEEDGHSHTVEVVEPNVPENLWPVIHRLTAYARTVRR